MRRGGLRGSFLHDFLTLACPCSVDPEQAGSCDLAGVTGTYHPYDSNQGVTIMIKRTFATAALVLACATAFSAVPVSRAQAAEAHVKCDLTYNLAGWSLFYKHATGNGTISCDNGQHANVKIVVVPLVSTCAVALLTTPASALACA